MKIEVKNGELVFDRSKFVLVRKPIRGSEFVRLVLVKKTIVETNRSSVTD